MAEAGVTLDVADFLKTQANSTLGLEKEDDLEYDLGNLCAFDDQPIDPSKKGAALEAELQRLAQSNMQRLVNQIFGLETETDQVEGSSFLLPFPTSKLPREKPVPTARPQTKWEVFAASKGINKKTKKDRMVWDEEKEDWRPVHGYKKADDNLNDWLIEEKEGEDLKGAEDPFLARKQAEKEKKAKAKDKEARNEKRGKKKDDKKPGVPATVALTNTKEFTDGTNKRKTFKDKKHLQAAVQAVQGATASMGRFDTHRKDEPRIKRGVKAKRAPVSADKAGMGEEKERSMAVLTKMFGAGANPSINMNKALKVANLEQEQKNRERKGKTGAGKKKRNLQDATRDKGIQKREGQASKKAKN